MLAVRILTIDHSTTISADLSPDSIQGVSVKTLDVVRKRTLFMNIAF